MRLLQAVGQNSMATVAGLGDFAMFASRAVAAAPATRQLGRRWISAVHEQGVRCVPVITIVALFAGLVLGLQGYYVLARFGAAGTLWRFFSLTPTPEPAPGLPAPIIALPAGGAHPAYKR